MATNWSNKNVLVTGVTGFVGGNLVKKLHAAGANVFGILRSDNPSSFLFFEGLNKKIRLIKGDIVDRDLLFNTITEQQINVIYHLAAQVEVGVGLTNPFLTFETNVRGTYNLLEACRMAKNSGHNIEAIVVASSDKAYGEYPVEKMPYREDYPLLPKFPYDTSKACADMICNAYAIDQYKLPIVVTRFSNIYGPGQMNFSAIVPDGIRSALNYSTFIPRSDGSMVRDFIFAEDVADLYMRIAVAITKDPDSLRGQVFNAGSNEPINMRSLLTKIYQEIGNIKELKRILDDMKGRKTTGEIQYQHMSFDKVFEYFNWKPQHNIEAGIKKTIEWFKRYFENYNN
jgi:CDP-glucose 4,6-dehydratase